MSVKLLFYSCCKHSVGIDCTDIHGVYFFLFCFFVLVFMNCVIGAYKTSHVPCNLCNRCFFFFIIIYLRSPNTNTCLMDYMSV